LGCLLAWTAARAADVAWIDALGGDFQDPLNWSTGAPPGPSDTAIFDLLSLYTVTFSSDAQSAGLRVLDDKVTLDLGGFSYSVLGPDPQLLIGGQPGMGLTGRLSVVNGSLDSTRAEIGPEAGSVGILEVAGPGTTLSLPGPGGQIIIGAVGNGSVEVLNGAHVTVGRFLTVGSAPGGVGTLSVAGPGSTLTVSLGIHGGGLSIGLDGAGSAYVTQRRLDRGADGERANRLGPGFNRFTCGQRPGLAL
jgi:T5SS/PEP-CTERM-associated repeat protein